MKKDSGQSAIGGNTGYYKTQNWGEICWKLKLSIPPAKECFQVELDFFFGVLDYPLKGQGLGCKWVS